MGPTRPTDKGTVLIFLASCAMFFFLPLVLFGWRLYLWHVRRLQFARNKRKPLLFIFNLEADLCRRGFIPPVWWVRSSLRLVYFNLFISFITIKSTFYLPARELEVDLACSHVDNVFVVWRNDLPRMRGTSSSAPMSRMLKSTGT